MGSKTNFTVNGKNYFRVSASFGRDSKGKLIRKYFYGKTKKEAMEKLDRYKISISNGVDISKKAYLYPTMKMWLFESIRKGIKESTFDRYEGVFRNLLENASIAYKDVKDIKMLDIQRLYNNLYKEGKSSNRINKLNILLKKFFYYCIDEGYIIRNPCNSVTIPGKNEYKEKDVEVFTKEELRKILNANYNYNRVIKDIAIVAFSTGMRAGEILALTENDIDFENNIIDINKIVSEFTRIYDDGSRHKVKNIQPPKTKNSIRKIPLPRNLIPVFKDAIITRNKYKLHFGDIYNTEYFEKKFIFLTKEGNLIYTTNLNKSWRYFLKNIGVSYKKFHALRHTYATFQFRSKVPLKTVSKLLGHSNIKVTADTYTHVMKKDLEEAANIINVLKM